MIVRPPGHLCTVTHLDDPDHPDAPVVVGVSLECDTSTLAVPRDQLLEELAKLLASAHPRIPWRVHEVHAAAAPRVQGPVPVSTVLARGRSVLLAEDLDVVVVLTDVPLEFRGRPVSAHVSPVQQSIVLSTAQVPPSRLAEEAASLVSALFELDDQPDGEHPVLRQLASSVPGDVEGPRFAVQTLGRNAVLLFTLVKANRPWLLTLHLSRTLVGAFAAAFVAVVTPDFWLLADRMSPLRLSMITLLVLAVACGVLVVGGDLRERAPSRRARRTVLLHNTAVWLSVGIGVATLYAGLVSANLAVTLIVLPWRLVAQTVGHSVGLEDMLRVGALTGVVALVGSAFGAGLEDDDDVHAATYTGSDDARFLDVEPPPD